MSTLTRAQRELYREAVERPPGKSDRERRVWAFSFAHVCMLEGVAIPTEQAVLAGLTQEGGADRRCHE
jgi:hypothetical protein